MLKQSFLSFAPSNSLSEVRKYAGIILKSVGGDGCLLEALLIVNEYNRGLKISG
jgi:3-deoxy-D-manno-octulosonate 8-phosphate phosphatase KdsC-like HAD superfamily phosphatase